jgi:hypothetical protein
MNAEKKNNIIPLPTLGLNGKRINPAIIMIKDDIKIFTLRRQTAKNTKYRSHSTDIDQLGPLKDQPS